MTKKNIKNFQGLTVIFTIVELTPAFFRWYPPGHGDIYSSFYNSGLLEEFIKAGKTYMFVSNIDNLGATVDTSILYYKIEPVYENLVFIA